MSASTRPFRRNSGSRTYTALRDLTAEEIIGMATSIITRRFRRSITITCPNATKDYLFFQLGTFEQEVFACMFLDNRHRIIEFEKLFFGTIDNTTVYSREVVKKVLRHNAAAVIFAHNHPSGVEEPSEADRLITRRLKQALDLIDVRVLDHIIVGGEGSTSLAERGWL